MSTFKNAGCTTSQRSLILALLVIFVISLSPQPGMCQQSPISASDYEPNILLAAVASGTSMTSIMQILKPLGATVVGNDTLSFGNLIRIKAASGKLYATYQALSQNSTLIGVQPNFRSAWFSTGVKPTSTVNDPLFPSQWNTFAMQLPASWKVSKANPHYIAFLDSGFSIVADLKPKMVTGASTVAGSSCFLDDASGGGHGTMMASVAAAATNNSYQMAAADPWAYVYPVKIGNVAGTDDEHIIMGLNYVMKSGIKVTFIGAGPTTAGWTLLGHPLVYAMLGLYNEYGGLAFAPAGNSGVSLSSTPQDPNLILVAASDQQGNLASFSNYGGPVWFGAPGVSIYAINNSGQSIATSGTSSSAAMVAALAGLIWSNNPSLSNTALLGILQASASGQGQLGPQLGYGIINAQSAVTAAGSSSSSP